MGLQKSHRTILLMLNLNPKTLAYISFFSEDEFSILQLLMCFIHHYVVFREHDVIFHMPNDDAVAS